MKNYTHTYSSKYNLLVIILSIASLFLCIDKSYAYSTHCCCETLEGQGSCVYRGWGPFGWWACVGTPLNRTKCAEQDSCGGGFSDSRDDDVSTCKKKGDPCKTKSRTCQQSGPQNTYVCEDIGQTGRVKSCNDVAGPNAESVESQLSLY
jgi:hypothetical protein